MNVYANFAEEALENSFPGVRCNLPFHQTTLASKRWSTRSCSWCPCGSRRQPQSDSANARHEDHKLAPIEPTNYRFVLFIVTRDKGPEEHICAETCVGADILLVPPVFLVNCECPLPLVSVTITYIFPVTEGFQRSQITFCNTYCALGMVPLGSPVLPHEVKL